MQDLNRRAFLKGAGVATLGLAAVSGLAGALISCTPKAASEAGETSPTQPTSEQTSPIALPWPYVKLDPDKVGERAYTAYYNGGCMYGAFEGIIGELAAEVGAPFNTFPSTMMKYGGAGVQGWGTLCGCLNGISAAVAMLTDTAKVGGALTSEVFAWYGATELPNYKPATPKFDTVQKSISELPLCHISVTKWCNESGFKANSAERAERCAWLTASTAHHTVELLNKALDNLFQATFTIPASVTGCLSCHGKGGINENVHMTKQLDCTECHSSLTTNHPLE